MPDETISVDDYITTYLDPLADSIAETSGGAGAAAQAAIDGFRVALAAILPFFNVDSLADVRIPSPFPPPDGAPGGGAAGLAPIDPGAALQALAAGIRDAENLLNETNLAVASAGAEVRLTVDVGGIAGADAVLNFTIGPAPRS